MKLPKLSKSQEKLFRAMSNLMEACGVRIALSTGLPDGSTFSGEFAWPRRTLEVVTDDDEWFETFVHEFCHFLQKIDGRWASEEDDEAENRFFAWMRNEIELGSEELLATCRMIQECELDCEQRTGKLLELCGFGSPDHIAHANAYVLSYDAMRRYKKRGCPTDDLIGFVPHDRYLTKDEFSSLSDGFVAAFLEEAK